MYSLSWSRINILKVIRQKVSLFCFPIATWFTLAMLVYSILIILYSFVPAPIFVTVQKHVQSVIAAAVLSTSVCSPIAIRSCINISWPRFDQDECSSLCATIDKLCRPNKIPIILIARIVRRRRDRWPMMIIIMTYRSTNHNSAWMMVVLRLDVDRSGNNLLLQSEYN